MFRNDLLEGKRILVAGGVTGFGKSMARRFLDLGAEVIIVGRQKSALSDAAGELLGASGKSVTTHEVNVGVADAVEEAIGKIWSDGPLDALVNAEDDLFVSRTEGLSAGDFINVAHPMFHGAFYLTNAVGKRWIENGRRGAVISIVSTWVWTGSPFVTAASMSQAGIAAMTQGLAVEWGPKGVRLNAIAPGAFASEDGRGDRAAGNVMATDAIPMGRSGDHRELANLAVFLLSDECAYLTGEVIAIDGGQWLNGAGTFTRYGNLSDEDWKQIRNQSWKGTTQKK